MEAERYMRAAIITVSDRALKKDYRDLWGEAAAEHLRSAGIDVVRQKAVPEEFEAVARALREWSGPDENIDLIVTVGRTGLSRRDITPEATMSVVDRTIPGIAEAIRAAGRQETPSAMLSRGVAGVKNSTLIINLSDTVERINQTLDVVVPVLADALGMIRGELVEA
jgi:molybdopterin adenylyltransferase